MRDEMTYRGTVVDTLPQTMFRVEDSNGFTHLCAIAGKMFKFNIRVMLGDKVEFVLSPDKTRGRIVKRFKL